MAPALATPGRKCRYVVAGEVEETLIACGFVVGVYILALAVLDYLDVKTLLVES